MLVLLFIRDHWRALLALVVAVLLFVAGLIVGARSVKPVQLPPQVVDVVKWKEHDQTTEAKTEEKHEDQVKVKTITVFRDRFTAPDGTVQEHTERHVDSGEHNQAEAKAETVRVETREVQVEVEKRVEVPAPLPRWRVGALVGVDLTHPPLLSDGRVGVGAIVERRLVGPLSVGAWGLHTGPIGVALTVELP